MIRKIDLAAVPVSSGSNYPAPFNGPCEAQDSRKLHAGLTAFGVNLTTLEPGTWSSQRHWHSHEDEFIWVLEGELVLVTDSGEETLGPGDCAAFRRGDPDGHHLINRTDRPAKVLEVGNASPLDVCTYSDIDMMVGPGELGYRRKDGRPYPGRN